ncbi:MAG: hypothetical protein IT270_06150 [Saprospiraceae bacterium]|nr:hypothetical protein [Saprospiraceae bacterium]
MRKMFLGITIIALCASCNTHHERANQENNLEQKANPISDPDLFVGKHKAKAMILGVFHFDNPGLDSYKPKFPFNILEKKRQEELEILLNQIAEYKPTKILVEWSRIRDDSVANERYIKYLNGTFSIDDKRNEVYQLGFKLAKKMGHKRIYCSDASAEWFGVELDWDNYDVEAYLKSKGQYEKSTRYDFQSFYAWSDSLKTVQTLTEHLAMLNSPKNRLKDHQAYLTELILEGAGDNYVGADAVAKWYRRNLRIFANAYDFADFDSEERLLLIYGSGHVWQLRQLFMDSPDFEYVELNEYLTK